ncbi:hypothetical protein M5585_12660 [Serratia ureilytica]
MTNLNVVHTLASLNLPVCAGGTCAVNIQAGSGAVSGSPFIDICPAQTRTAVVRPRVLERHLDGGEKDRRSQT